ncbi:hypothetical protein [Tahibacter amnicola]|uniref:Uncharacterized protein n=1 Tax=Tahibacter amnicola TaxID=2976241 RepID=A0ABY6BAZ1_9GAMM|nr:hypothetical protein [Tahibacter amnicola]UXI65801.1 hypothetical protein N4264_13610 [Tahibacter amnicola]
MENVSPDNSTAAPRALLRCTAGVGAAAWLLYAIALLVADSEQTAILLLPPYSLLAGLVGAITLATSATLAVKQSLAWIAVALVGVAGCGLTLLLQLFLVSLPG